MLNNKFNPARFLFLAGFFFLFFAFLSFINSAYASYLPTTGSNVGIGTSTPVGGLVILNGNVGVGTWSPVGSLEVKGKTATRIWTGAGTDTNATGAGELYVEGDLEVDGTIYGDGSGITALPSTLAAGGWTDGGTNIYQTTTSDNVGIGTTSPSTTLEVVKQSNRAPLMISSTATGAGDFLNVASSGNIGIGSTAPNYQLDLGGFNGVSNTLRISSGSNNATLKLMEGSDNFGFSLRHDGITSNDFQILRHNNDATGAVAMVITRSSGNVGIGTDMGSAAAKLAVLGGNVGIGTVTPVGGTAIMNGNVGVGTWSPSANLHIANGPSGHSASSTGNLAFFESSGDNGITIGSGVANFSRIYFGHGTFNNLQYIESKGTNWYLNYNAFNNHIFSIQGVAKLKIDLNGNLGVGTTTPVNGTAIMNGNVGIGTWSPNSQLEVKGGSASIISTGGTNTNATGAGELYVQGDLEVDGTIYGDGSGLTALPSTLAAGGWVDGGTNVYQSTTSDKVGIGTTSPESILEISSQAAAVDLLHINDNGVGDSTPLVVTSVGNVGIGTSTSDYKLSVVGTANFTTNVGIGTTSPQAILDIKAAGTTLPHIRMSNIGNDNAGLYAYSAAQNPIFTFTRQRNDLSITGYGGIGFIAGATAGPSADYEMYLTATGSLGVGTFNPTGRLDVRGDEVRIWTGAGTDTNATSAGELYVEGDLEVDGTIYGDGSGLTALPSTLAAGGWVDGGTNVYQTTTSDNVGIGTTSPVAAFDITSSASNDLFRVNDNGVGDASPFIIDSLGNVGIGTTTPDATLQVETTGNTAAKFTRGASNARLDIGNQSTHANITSLSFTGSSYRDLRFETRSGGTMALTTGGNVGIGTTAPIGGLIVMSGNVGVGTWSPIGALEVKGLSATRIWTGAGTDTNATAAGELYVEGDLEVDGTIYGDGSGITSLSSSLPAGGWTDGGGSIYNTTTTDYVGIGTSSPQRTLHIAGASLDLAGNDQYAGNVLITSTDAAAIDKGGSLGFGGLYGGAGPWTFGSIKGAKANSTASNGDGYLAFYTAGSGGNSSERVRLDSNGNLGVGTINPTSKLAVSGALAVSDSIFELIKLSNVGGFANIDANSTMRIGPVTSNSILFKTGDTARMWINTGGNVGIGTDLTSASARLAVLGGNVGIGTVTPVGGTAIMNGNVGIGTWVPRSFLDIDTQAGSSIVTGLRLSASNIAGIGSGSAIDFRTSPLETAFYVARIAGLRGGSAGNSGGSNLAFSTQDATGIPLERMRIAYDGNVGIGTWNPSAALMVQGAPSGNGLYVRAGENTGDYMLRVEDEDGTVKGLFIDSNGGVGLGTETIANARLAVMSGNVGLGTVTPVNGTAIMNGRVGIGTWSPNSQLEVKGGNASVISTGGTNTNATGAGELYVQGDLEVDGTIYGDGSGITALPTTLAAGGWTDGGTNVYQAATSDNVGIGTTSPSTTLEIVKQPTRAPLMVSSSATGAGDFLKIDSAGHVGIGTVSTPAALSVLSGNVGVGTAKPPVLFAVGNGVPVSATAYNDAYFAHDVEIKGNLYANTVIGGQIFAGDIDLAGYFLRSTTGGLRLAVNANTAPDLFIDTSSHVGVGTSTPTAKLLVENTGADDSFRVNDALLDASPFLIDAAGNVGVGTTTPVGGLAVMNGNVGIGTWSPSDALVVMNGNVGIGTTNPTQPVEILGNNSGGNGLRISRTGSAVVYSKLTDNSLTLTGAQVLQRSSGLTTLGTTWGAGLNITTGNNVGIGTDMTSATGRLIVLNGNVGLGTITPLNGTAIMNGNVGIGTWSPSSGLELKGGNASIISTGGTNTNATGAGELYVQGDLEVDGTIYGDGSGLTSLPAGLAAGGWTDAGSTVNLTTDTDRVGIGTTLTAAGTGLSIMNGNVGIGTWSPTASLAVSGNAYVTGGLGIGVLNTTAGTISADTGNLTAFAFNYSGGNSSTADIFRVTKQSASLFEVQSNGTVGIGTATSAGGLSVMNGNVGIGTYSPLGTMQLVNSGAFPQLLITNPTSGTNMKDWRLTAQSSIFFIGTLNENTASTGDAALTIARETNSNDVDYIELATNNEVNRMRLDNTGALGIGTTTPVGGTAIMNGNVGIGTWSANSQLEVKGGAASIISTGGTNTNATGAGELYVQGDLEVDGTIYGDGSGLTSLPSTLAAGGWVDGGANVYQSATSDNVGIGTTSPVAALDITSTAARDLFRINDNGVADNTPFLVDSNGYVGIGTTSPLASVEISNAGSLPTLWIEDSASLDDTPFVIDSVGNVGIGTSNVDAKFVIVSPNTSGEQVLQRWIYNPAFPAAYYLDLKQTVTAGVVRWNFAQVNNSVTYDNTLVLDRGNIGVGTAYPSGRFIVWNGNVGIGTATPVNGTAIMNGNVGIGTWSPNNALEVDGNAKINDAFLGDWVSDATYGVFSNYALRSTAGSYAIMQGPTGDTYVNAASGKPIAFRIANNTKIQLDNTGNVGIGTTSPHGGLVVMSGNVGIGTWKPQNQLEVSGGSASIISTGGTNTNATGAGELYVQGDLEVDGTIYGDGSGLTSLPSTLAAGGWVDGGTNVYQSATSDNVGIGTTSPVAALDITSTAASDLFRVNDNGPGDITPFLIDSTGNVGIGTINITRKLSIPGSISMGIASSNALYVHDGTLKYGIGISTTPTTSTQIFTGNNIHFIRGDLGSASSVLMTIDSSADVGIGTITPQSTLDVFGPTASASIVRISSANSSNSGYYAYSTTPTPIFSLTRQTAVATADLSISAYGGVGFSGGSTSGPSTNYRMYLSNAGNLGIGTTAPVGGLAVMNGNVGVGTWSPNNGLEVKGVNAAMISTGGTNTNATGAGELYVEGDLEVDGTIYGDGSGITSLSSSLPAGGWTDAGATVSLTTDTDRVGIGTNLNAAATALSIMNGNVGIGTWVTIAPLTIKGGNIEVYGSVVAESDNAFRGGSLYLTSGSQIKSSIQSTGSPYDMVFNVPNGNERMRISNSGNIGIGTVNPLALLATGPGNVGIGTIYPVNGTAIMNGNVGIGTWSPKQKVEIVSGNIMMSNLGSATPYGVLFAEGATQAMAIKYDGAGSGTENAIRIYEGTDLQPLASFQFGGNVGIGTTTPVGGFVVMNGNVGIGTWSPNNGLEVKGVNAAVISTGGTNTNATGAGELYVQGDLEVDGTIYGDGSGLTSLPAGLAAGGWVDGGTNVFQSATSDNVGIGTTSPVATLDITSTAANDLLRINDNGVGDSSPFIIDSTGNVGIGTTAPGTFVHMFGSAPIVTIQATLAAGDPVIKWLSAAQNWYAGIDASENSNFKIARSTLGTGFDVITIDNNGNVGIGTGLTSATARLAVWSGNVGIGTVTPVNGTAIMNGNVGIGTWSPNGAFVVMNGNVGIGFAAPAGKFIVEAPGSSAYSLGISRSNNNNLSLGVIEDGSANAYLSMWDASDLSRVQLHTSGVSYLNGGNVGIGTTMASAAAKLAVIGGNVGIGTITPVGGTAIMNGNVGIGTWSPGSELYVSGGASVAVTVKQAATSAFTQYGSYTIQSFNQDLRINGSGNNVLFPGTGNIGVGTTTPVGKWVVVGGNVGIGTWSPNSQLEVKGGNASVISTGGTNTNATGAGELYVQGDLEVDGTIYGDGSGITSLSASLPAGGWVDGGASVFQSTTSDNVGIGTTTPVAALDITSTAANDLFRINDNGVGDASPFVITSTGNVGVGTTNPLGALYIDGGSGGTSGYGDLTIEDDTRAQLVLKTTTAGSQYEYIQFVGAGNDFEMGQSNSDGVFYLNPTVNAGATGASLAIATSGNVGIGTINPLAGLAVMNGNVGIGTIYPVNGTAIMNGNVGIGTWSPQEALHISGNFRQELGTGVKWDVYNGNSFIAGTRVYSAYTNFHASGDGTRAVMTLRSGAVGIGTNTPVGGLAVLSGNVGIGTWSANNGLEVKGVNAAVISTGGTNTNATGAGELYVQGDLEVDGTIYGDGSGITSLPSTLAAGGWVDGGTNVFQSATSDNVGIGTTSPATTLEIVKQSSSAPLMISSAPSGFGDYVIVDSAGNVGVGTIIPMGKLEVRSTANTLIPSLNTAVTSAQTALSIGNVATNVFLAIGQDNANHSWLQSRDKRANGSAYTLLINPLGGNVGIGTSAPLGGFVVMNGNVGIGTQNPVEALTVNGNIQLGQANPALNAIISNGASSGTLSVRSGTAAALRLQDTNSSTAGRSAVVLFAGATQSQASGSNYGLVINPVYNQSGTAASTDLLINRSETALGSGAQYLLDAQVGNISKFNVSNTGNVGVGTTLSTGGLAVMTGNVGIGTWSPRSGLEVKGPAVAQVTIDGPSGGCLMFRDTDNGGWTECNALDGSLQCSVDADGICDGS